MEYFEAQDADIFCLQETKCSAGQVELDLKGYYQYWNYAVKKGYSGTAIFTKKEPLSVSYGLGIEEHDQEGRVICLDRKSTRLNSSHANISYAVFCLKKKKKSRDNVNNLSKLIRSLYKLR